MQLKVTPKEALTVLDSLIKEGDKLYKWIKKDYNKIDRIIEVGEKESMKEFKKKKLAEENKMKVEDLKKKKEEEQKKEEMEKAMEEGHFTIRLDNPSPSFFETINNVADIFKRSKRAIDETADAFKKMQQNSALMMNIKEEDGSWSIDKKDEIYKICIGEYEQKSSEWAQKAYNTLEIISGDYVYFRQFELAVSKRLINTPSLNILGYRNVDTRFDDYVDIHSEILEKINFLQDLYLEVEKKVTDPLFYIAETNKLCYYNRVIQLQSSSNQSSFCEFMFQFAIGEKKEVAEIVAFMEGVDIESMLKVDRKKVVNAMNEINEKTKKMFGFPLFHKDKNTVYICPNP